MMVKLALSLLTIYLVLGSVLAYDKMCDFNGSVRLNKSDLLPYTSDQAGCLLQKTGDGSGILIFAFVGLLIIIFIYSLGRRHR
jgi:hypothetical protein